MRKRRETMREYNWIIVLLDCTREKKNDFDALWARY